MKSPIKFSLSIILILWVIRVIDMILPFRLNNFGILPRSIKGLPGIIISPFLHGDITHLLSNSVPLFILLIITLSFYEKIGGKVILIIILLGGSLVWAFGRSAHHIGASGLIYGLAAFLFASGFFRKNIKSIIVSVIVFFAYGGLIYGIFPIHSWMSWEGHLFGAISGIIGAYVYKNPKDSNQKKRLHYGLLT